MRDVSGGGGQYHWQTQAIIPKSMPSNAIVSKGDVDLEQEEETSPWVVAATRGGYNSDDITKVRVGGAVEPGGSDDGMTITICSFDSFTGIDDSELQAILAKCVKK